jgi:histidyl-tRNA synthetase
MSSIQASRGTFDILPSETTAWQHVEATARQILAQAAYAEIRTPIFEQTELYKRGIGEATDIVGKEMYTFLDQGKRSLTLRPEGTAGVVRAAVEHGLLTQGGCQRLWYLGPMFRYERPGAGRQRQFHQLGVEVLGASDPRADAEVIALAMNIFATLGLQDFSLALNSIGSGEDRQRYRQALVDYLTPYQADLDRDSQDRLQRNPLRILDSKDQRTQEICLQAPSIIDYLGTNARQHFEQVQICLQSLGITYDLNPRLVRGLDYYTDTAFEIITPDPELGSQSTICGGGRYDRLIQELGGPATPAVGWAIGLERLVLLLKKQSFSSSNQLDFYVVARGALAEVQALKLAHQLRGLAFATELDLSGSAFGKQLKRADRSGAVACLILGDTEAAEQTVQIKWLASGEQSVISQMNLFEQASELKEKISTIKQIGINSVKLTE